MRFFGIALLIAAVSAGCRENCGKKLNSCKAGCGSRIVLKLNYYYIFLYFNVKSIDLKFINLKFKTIEAPLAGPNATLSTTNACLLAN